MDTERSQELVEFYRGLATDYRGRYLRDILLWTDSDLEYVHDYIQWLFPTYQRSVFQPDVPILTEEMAAAFRTDSDLKCQLAKSFDRMLRFYGFTIARSSELSIVIAPNFSERAEVWLTLGNHNHLRITRILKSLTSLGLEEEADAFLKCLEELYEHSAMARHTIQDVTLEFWRSGVQHV